MRALAHVMVVVVEIGVSALAHSHGSFFIIDANDATLANYLLHSGCSVEPPNLLINCYSLYHLCFDKICTCRGKQVSLAHTNDHNFLRLFSSINFVGGYFAHCLLHSSDTADSAWRSIDLQR